MIKVLHLIWRIDGGGIEQFCLNLKKIMNPAEFIFDFVVCGEKCEGEDIELLNDSKIFHLPWINGKKGKRQYLKELKKILQINHYDVVHSHLAFMNIATLKIAKECGIPTRISHAHVGPSNGSFFKRAFKRFLMNYYATQCFACSHESAQFFHGLKSKKSSVLYSGVETSRFCKKITKNPYLFIIVARIIPIKNPQFILDVAEELFHINSNFTFSWCGDGHDLASIQQEAKRKQIPITFHGAVNNVEDYLGKASYMLFPSIKEGFGMVAVEAQLSEVTVFASDRVPKDTDLGLIEYYPLDSANMWAKRIMSVINANHPQKLDTTKINKYDIQIIANKIFNYYRNNTNYNLADNL